MVGEVRQSLGRNAHTTFLIVDAQSVKNTDTAEQKGFDGGKLVSGIKRHIGVDTNGLPHMIHVTTANVTDRAGALEGFALYKSNLINVVNVLVDGGYIGDSRIDQQIYVGFAANLYIFRFADRCFDR